MPISKAEFSNYINSFQFRELFNEMGWNNDRAKQAVVVDDAAFHLSGIAEKSGFRIFLCEPEGGNKLPDAATRKKIESKLTRLFQEHLIIFVDAHKREQIWQLAVRKAGSPTKISEIRHGAAQDPERLHQRAGGLFFTLEEEEVVTIIDVTKRVADNFYQNQERVTKKFYELFKKKHGAFLSFIKGIGHRLDHEWYASLMLNRLMFCYFIQKKGFLDDNRDYLRDKLKACRDIKGKNRFYSFYRDFLLALFHKGLGGPNHSRELEVAIGKIPYLNGGLFDVHEIEKRYEHITIDDEAFEALFEFFDDYDWHLDSRETASGKDINPDVIGYIFEKYINDRAQMGAYYTKEDITDYIAKNCIIPWLFDDVKRRYPQAFAKDGWIWRMVKESGDAYIYDAVKYGMPKDWLNAEEHELQGLTNESALFSDLPEDIRQGFQPELEQKGVDGQGPWLWELRKCWNRPAPADIALPTETYREVIERRRRCADVKIKIACGEIQGINDFITHNLNIRQFAQDVIESSDDPDFIRHFYKSLTAITILDPTCGSGAFLFAALNVLEPLYEACIQRMDNFIAESDKGRHKFFEETLARVNAPEHPNIQYFIFKSIILNNLYGVDIMKEAVEIAKLRLFLKLAATVDADYHKPNLGLEPLPDIDFNIRAGNTLVGFVTETDLDKTLVGELHGVNAKSAIKEKCDIVAHAFARYKEIQLSHGDNFKNFCVAKEDLNNRLTELNDQLNRLLHKSDSQAREYDEWLTSHQPFHWFAEFYEIVAVNGGFDVVIGNPPYVEYSKVRKEYQIQNYVTKNCGNLYAFAIERAYYLMGGNGRFGFIVPISFTCTQRMESAQNIILNNSHSVFLSNYSERPGKLFTGAEVLLTIIISQKKIKSSALIHSTGFMKWTADERQYLFDKITYFPIIKIKSFVLPKLSCPSEINLARNINQKKSKFGIYFKNNSKHIVYYRIGGGRYWKIFTSFQPNFLLNNEKCVSSRESYIYFSDEITKNCAISLLSSSLFYWHFISSTNCRDLNPVDLYSFPISIDDISLEISKKLSEFSEILMTDYNKNSQMKDKISKLTGTIKYQEFYPRLSKPIIDQIDCLLAQHYGFTHEELDFIINYDIKYRMGLGKNDPNEEDE